jgi:transposase
MKPPIFVHPLTDTEQEAMRGGLRSANAFVLKRCQIVLASNEGQSVPEIYQRFGYPQNSIRQVVHAFNQDKLAALCKKSCRPKTGPAAQAVLDQDKREALRTVLEQSPRAFDKEASFWTLSLLAQVSFEQGITERLLDQDTLGIAVKRLGLNWKRVRHRIQSPDPAYAHKKSGATP